MSEVSRRIWLRWKETLRDTDDGLSDPLEVDFPVAEFSQRNSILITEVPAAGTSQIAVSMSSMKLRRLTKTALAIKTAIPCTRARRNSDCLP